MEGSHSPAPAAGPPSVAQQLCGPSYDLTNADLAGKIVLYRADLNLPVLDGKITDSTRLAATLPTLEFMLGKGARVAVLSHFSRPNPKQQTLEEMRSQYSLAPVAEALQQQLGAAFQGLAQDCIGPPAQTMIASLQPGQVCLLENVRFHLGEVTHDDAFAQQLASLGQVYVNDAFGAVHRDQASVTGITRHIGVCYPGLLLRTELRFFTGIMAQPVRPYGVIIGGCKVADKLSVVDRLIEVTDVLMIGGRMAFTFLAANGVSVGMTQVERDWLPAVRELQSKAAARGVQLLLPNDVLVAESLDDDRGCCTVPLTTTCCSKEAPCIPAGCVGLDIGPSSRRRFVDAIGTCRTIFWNGPMGRVETPAFREGTAAVAHALAAATRNGCITIVGGGDSVAAVKQMLPTPTITYLSTGGGASLALIEGKDLPGLVALTAAHSRCSTGSAT